MLRVIVVMMKDAFDHREIVLGLLPTVWADNGVRYGNPACPFWCWVIAHVNESLFFLERL